MNIEDEVVRLVRAAFATWQRSGEAPLDESASLLERRDWVLEQIRKQNAPPVKNGHDIIMDGYYIEKLKDGVFIHSRSRRSLFVRYNDMEGKES